MHLGGVKRFNIVPMRMNCLILIPCAHAMHTGKGEPPIVWQNLNSRHILQYPISSLSFHRPSPPNNHLLPSEIVSKDRIGSRRSDRRVRSLLDAPTVLGAECLLKNR